MASTPKSFKHRFINGKTDGADTTVTRPSDWNADHDFFLGTNPQTGTTYTFVDADGQSLVTFNNASAVAGTLPQAGASSLFKLGWATYVRNLGAGALTITPTTSTINGAATFALAQNESAIIFSDGTNYSAFRCDVTRPTLYASPFDALACNGMQVNGSMEIDQSYNGALFSSASGYAIDCVQVLKNGTMVLASQQVSDAPPGLTKSIKVTVTTAEAAIAAGDYALLHMPIEGQRVARLGFGVANAQPLSIGFWVKAHRTGSYSGFVGNGASTRAYPFSFTVNAADTWEFKAFTLSGDTAGTWQTGSSTGLSIGFAIAVGSTFAGTAGAWVGSNILGVTGSTNGVAATSDTFQITGVIVLPGVELPSSARAALVMRPFDHEMKISKRYWQKSYPYATAVGASGLEGATWLFTPAAGALTMGISLAFPEIMRATPTLTLYDVAGAAGKVYRGGNGKTGVADSVSPSGARIYTNDVTSSNEMGFHWVADARL